MAIPDLLGASLLAPPLHKIKWYTTPVHFFFKMTPHPYTKIFLDPTPYTKFFRPPPLHKNSMVHHHVQFFFKMTPTPTLIFLDPHPYTKIFFEPERLGHPT